jgi:hypothetical protein
MSSVKAVTQDIKFVVKVASFRPLQTEVLLNVFSKWVEQQGKEQNFLVWSVSIEGATQEYN